MLERFWDAFNKRNPVGLHRARQTLLASYAPVQLVSSIVCAQTTATAFYTMLSQSKSGFLFGTGLLLSCLGGNFAMFPALTSKVRPLVCVALRNALA